MHRLKLFEQRVYVGCLLGNFINASRDALAQKCNLLKANGARFHVLLVARINEGIALRNPGKHFGGNAGTTHLRRLRLRRFALRSRSNAARIFR